MVNTLKRVLACALSMLLLLSCLTACGSGGAQETTAPVATENPEEAKTLKVLTIGHSLAVDACHMLNLVAKTEGYEEMTIGTLYYSGCSLTKHVQFMNAGSTDYKLYLSSTTTADQPPKTIDNVSMQQALTYDYWDIVVMQGGTFDVAEDATYTSGEIQLIQKFVNTHKKNPNAVFMWHVPWAFSTELELQKTKDADLSKNFVHEGYIKFDNDRTKFYAAFAKCVNDHIASDETFTGLIPAGTAFENAMTSYLTEFDLHRDYGHASDLGRLIAAYAWYCALTGTTQLEEIKLDAIPQKFLKSTLDKTEDRVLTDNEKAIILESVNNALKNPLQVTQSQYTERPADYMPMR